MRKEADLLGELEIGDEAYYGVQTQRALNLCNPSKEQLNQYPELIFCLAAIKKACALAHCKLGILPKEVADAIGKACGEIMEGRFLEQFPVDLVSGGGCVTVNMNMNEVIASRASEIISGAKDAACVHGNNHVNMGQSTSDVVASATKLAIYFELGKVIAGIELLEKEYSKKSENFEGVVKVSRTCFQDAVPVTMGQYFGACASFLRRQVLELHRLREECRSICMGATVIGTGLGTFKGYHEIIMPLIAEVLGIAVKKDENYFDALQYGDFYNRVSGALKAAASGIAKMARDIRLMSSGPRSGFSEITIAPVQNGSSFMPGKVNPALPELMNIVCYQVCGNDLSITMAVEAGELDMNVWDAVFIINTLSSCKLMSGSLRTFAQKCVATIEVNETVCLNDAKRSLAQAVMVSALLGYKEGAKAAELAARENLTIKAAVVKLGFLDADRAEELLDPLMMSNAEQSSELLLHAALKNSKEG